MTQLFITLLLSFSGLFSGTSLAAGPFSDKELQDELNQFRSNPKLFYSSLPPKKGAQSQLVDSGLKGRRVKQNQRAQIILASDPWLRLSNPNGNDLAQNLLEDGAFISNIQKLADSELLSGEIDIKPWSDDYWPFYKGGLASRYSDGAFPRSQDWQENFDYYMAHPFFPIFESGSAPSINSLSPAEKYDLVIGAKGGALTSKMWKEGAAYYAATGKVEFWMGICHGWAPAAYMQKRPQKSVEVLAFDGKTKIKFYPADIKGLTSLLWANAATPVRFVGGRCNDEDPKVDSMGRPTSPDCLDTNPATWHLAITNRVGVSKKSFIIDATYDYQVWNQPVTSYTYTYFNPQTLNLTSSLDKAMIPITDFSEDKFKSYRSQGVKFVVGIKMQTTYLIENNPEQHDVEDPNTDTHATASYTYDLELDETGKIIGGEWYRNPHPDFLWTPTKDARAMAKNDYYLLGEPLWDGKQALPKTWQDHGRESATNGQPLLKIIDSLITLSLEN
ncbi:MAG: hypothetical protein SGJ18_03635 [Pseudomonadota bacterium]|mgnify:CR=1 FL=1|nr:hypothetical protein [Pseudomonadota bacterium]